MRRLMLVGCGGWAKERWLAEVWPAFKERIRIVAVVDNNVSVLKECQLFLGLHGDQCFTSVTEACNKVKAEICSIVTPPAAHAAAICSAAAARMHIICEKPLTDSLLSLEKVWEAVEQSGVKMVVTQNYRYEPAIIEFRRLLDNESVGTISHIVARYASDYRIKGSWDVGGVYTMREPLLIQAAVHHFDTLRFLSRSNCKIITGTTWNPSWSQFTGNAIGLFLGIMENGIRIIYEGSLLAAGGLNSWHREYYRAECSAGSISLMEDRTLQIHENGSPPHFSMVRPSPLVRREQELIVDEFLNWLDGGPASQTELKDNIHTCAMVLAAMEVCNQRGRPVSDYTSHLH